MKFTDEQKKELIDGFRRHDITQTVHLRGDFENEEKKKNKKKPKKVPKENPLKKRVLKYMESNLRDFGFKRYIRNFSEKNPINLLMDADATYISDEAMKMLADEKQTADAVEQYMELFWPLIEHAIESYCKEKSKEPEDITDDELRLILDRTTTVVNEELLSAVMQGQQFDEINKITHEAHAHEDFKDDSLWVSNTDAINFFNQWTHSDTKIGDICGKNYRRKTTPYNTVWCCSTFNTRGKAYCASQVIPEETLKSCIAEAFGWKVFTEDKFTGVVDHIIAEPENRLRLVMTDGTEKAIVWKAHSRSESWTEEMREAARQKMLQRKDVDR